MKDGRIFLAAMRPGFEKELGFVDLPAPNLKSFKQHQGMYRSFKWAMAYLAPSGIGPESPSTEDAEEQSSLDAIRVLELRKAIQTLRSAGECPRCRCGCRDTATWLGLLFTRDSSNRILRGSICTTYPKATTKAL